MPFSYKIEVMPSGSATLTSWLNTQGTSGWQLVQVIPMTNLNASGSGQIMCYFISGSN
jgi:hypothetical protein